MSSQKSMTSFEAQEPQQLVAADNMDEQRRLPTDPVAFVQDCVRRRQVLWTYHVNMRLDG